MSRSKNRKIADLISGGTFDDGVVAASEVTGLHSVASTGNFNELSNKPAPFDPATLASVAVSGSFNDLSDQPTPFDPSTLATVATTGAYSALSGKPSLGTASTQATGAFATAAQGALAGTALQPALAGVTSVDTATVAALSAAGIGGIPVYASEPSNPSVGDIYTNSVDKAMWSWTGAFWRKIVDRAIDPLLWPIVAGQEYTINASSGTQRFRDTFGTLFYTDYLSLPADLKIRDDMPFSGTFSIQVPSTSTFRIRVAGGASGSGSRSPEMENNFSLTAGEWLYVCIGGTSGGTFVWKHSTGTNTSKPSEPLIVSGGAGGYGAEDGAGNDGSITTSANNSGVEGANASIGQRGNTSSEYDSGGAGWKTVDNTSEASWPTNLAPTWEVGFKHPSGGGYGGNGRQGWAGAGGGGYTGGNAGYTSGNYDRQNGGGGGSYGGTHTGTWNTGNTGYFKMRLNT